MPNELPSKDGRVPGDELGEDQECWPGGSDGHMFVSGVNRAVEPSALCARTYSYVGIVDTTDARIGEAGRKTRMMPSQQAHSAEFERFD
jgi:hypothetical protein